MQRLARFQVGIAEVGAEAARVRNHFQQAMGRRRDGAQVGGGADVHRRCPAQLAQAPVEQGLEHPLGRADVVPDVACQAHGHAFFRGEARDDFTDRPYVMHVLVGVQVAGHQAMVQATLPLCLQLRAHGLARLPAQPQLVAGQAQVELAVAVAEHRLGQDRCAQRAPVGQVEMQADAPLQQGLLGQDAGGGKGRHVGHDGGRADHAGLERPQDDGVFIATEAKIVSVDYDLLRHRDPPGGCRG
ncbi:hypothetical protein D3C75_890760 [compost metagenome]